jgi:hypothetical protein
LQLEKQEEFFIGKMEELKALNKNHEKLNHSHTSLVGKHENLEGMVVLLISPLVCLY